MAPRKREGVEWQSDSAAKVCKCCNSAFTFVKRRHHCRACGYVVCGSCSQVHFKVNGSKKRTCVSCVGRLSAASSRRTSTASVRAVPTTSSARNNGATPRRESNPTVNGQSNKSPKTCGGKQREQPQGRVPLFPGLGKLPGRAESPQHLKAWFEEEKAKQEQRIVLQGERKREQDKEFARQTREGQMNRHWNTLRAELEETCLDRREKLEEQQHAKRKVDQQMHDDDADMFKRTLRQYLDGCVLRHDSFQEVASNVLSRVGGEEDNSTSSSARRQRKMGGGGQKPSMRRFSPTRLFKRK